MRSTSLGRVAAFCCVCLFGIALFLVHFFFIYSFDDAIIASHRGSTNRSASTSDDVSAMSPSGGVAATTHAHKDAAESVGLGIDAGLLGMRGQWKCVSAPSDPVSVEARYECNPVQSEVVRPRG